MSDTVFPTSQKTGLSDGLTKREMFAAMAMQGMIAAITDYVRDKSGLAGGIIEHRPRDIAEISRCYADALLAELAEAKP